jgi:predicted nucleotidyltransferase
MVYTISEIANKLTPVFEQNSVTKAILFGSYANGTATEESDVDIIIEAESHVKGWDYWGILDDMVVALEKRVEMIPKQDLIPNALLDIEVSKNGKVIYERAR